MGDVPSPDPARIAEDYFYLCCACGAITAFSTWTLWKRDDEDNLVPSEPGDSDPICRCPNCGWEHVDDDSNPGIYDGTHLEMMRARARLLVAGTFNHDDWPALAGGSR